MNMKIQLITITLLVIALILWFRSCKVTDEINFDCYIINLDRNTSRLVGSMNYYNQSDLNFVPLQRFSAIDGNNLDLNKIKNIVTPAVYNGLVHIDETNTRTHDAQLTRGMIGCYLSHLELFNKIIKSKYNNGIIFEDDIIINSNIYKNVIKRIDEIFPPDWDIILLGYITIFEYEDMKDYYKAYKFWGTQGYIINKRGAKKMLKHAIPIDEQIDHFMGTLARKKILNIYACKESMVVQNSMYSDVQMNVTN